MTQVSAQKTDKLERPKLVVGIVVDQMRWDYLYRYYDRYTAGGFRRMMNEGYNCQNTMINYLPTFTGPGHASIYTGTVPAIHGIASNDWIDNRTGKEVYCVDDETVRTIGGGMEKTGMMSPRNMITTTITDELEIVTQRKAKVFGIGLKDRGSILPAGHAADAAFWFDDSSGNFITSTFYAKELPKWMQQFNDKRWTDTFMTKTWDLLYPANTYTNSTADNMNVEGKLPGEDSSVFPHKTPNIKGKGYYGIRYMPWGNTLTLAAAMACVKGEHMGADDVPDFLAITLSTTDYAGHNYGPDALEMEDMYLRLDMELAELMQYLDKQVGKGQYTVFLTADHGAAHNATYMKDLRIPSGTIPDKDANKGLHDYLKQTEGASELIRGMTNYQVYFDEEAIAKSSFDDERIKALVTQWLHSEEGVAYVVDMEDMDDAVVPETLRTMIVNGYYRERSGQLQIVMKPGWYSGHGETGTTHGGWNPYDAHIPLLWYGWGINKGQTYRTVNMTDIAPTLAALLHIQMPNGCIGNVISEVIKD
ncbi:MAG: alkaline phosphatase family protein [Chitinophagaceae bacterium]|nr:alkaline phosphatase family protein [Chitinophagaceae bacterium]